MTGSSLCLLILRAAVATLPVAPDEPDPLAAPQCYPARSPITIDGDLSDWDRRGPVRVDDPTQVLADGSEAGVVPTGRDDAALVVHFEWDRENLYVGGEVKDDSRVYDDRLWFNGDCVELFLDTDRAGDLDRPVFDDDDFEICLMPYNPGRAWGVVKHGRESVLSDGGLQGIEVASKPTTGAGYVFEARLPWRNFPRFDHEARSVGIDVGFIDCDSAAGGAIERSFLVRSPSRFAYLTTRGFAPLEFIGSPRATSPDATRAAGSRVGFWLVQIAIALSLIFLVARFATASFERAHRLLRRVKKPLVVATGGVVLLLFIGPGLTTRVLEVRGREQFESAAGIVGRVIGGVAERDALGSGAAIERPEDLLALLRGERLPIPSQYEYTFIDLEPLEQAKNFRRSREGVPIREYGFPLAAGRQFYFPLPRPMVLSRLFVFGHARFDEAARERPGAAPLREQSLEIGLRLADGKLRTELFPVVDRRSPAAATIPLSERYGPGYEADGGMVEQYFLGAPTISDTLVQAIVVTLRDPAIGFDLHGITCAPEDASDHFLPLPLTRASLAGPPAAFWDGHPKNTAITLELDPAKNTARFPVRRQFDSLWFFYDSLDPRALDPALRGVEVGRFVARDSTGAEHVAPLRAGVNLFHGLYDAAKRPSDTDSRVAFRWDAEPGSTRRIEMLELKLPGTPEIEEIHFENKGPLTSISLYAVTGGTRGRPAVLPAQVPGLTFVGDAEELRIAPDLAGVLEASDFAVLVDDVVATADFRDEARNKTLVGARPPFGDATPDGTGEAGQRIVLFGEPYRTHSFALSRPDGHEWRAVLFSPVAGVTFIARAQRHGIVLALLLGIPLLVIFALDFGTRIARLGPRLTTLLVATSLTPIVVLFAVLYNFVADDRARLRESRVDAAMREVQHRIDLSLAQARQIAEQIAGSDVLRAVRTDAPLDEQAIRSYLTDVIAVRQAAAQGVDLAVRLELDVSGGQRVRFHDRPEAESMSRFDLDGRGLFVHWDELVFLWTQNFTVGSFRRRITVAGEVLPGFVRELEKLAGVEVALLARDARPLADSRLLDPLFVATDVERIRRQNRPVVRSDADGALEATTLLALGDAEPAALLQIRIPPDEFLIDVLFARLPLESFFFWFCVLGLGAAVYMGSVATSRITGPMEHLERAVRRVGRGELDVQVELPARGRGEVAKLAESFNAMARELHLRASERRRFERAMVSLNASIDVEPTACAALAVLAEHPPVASTALYVRDAERDRWLRHGTHSTLDPAAPLEIAKARLFDAATGRREPLLLGAGTTTPALLAAQVPEAELTLYERALGEGGPALVLPLLISDRSIGVAVVRYPAALPAESVAAEMQTLIHLAGQIAVSLENAKLYQLAVADPETGLFVESFLRSRLAEEVDRAQRRRSRLTLLVVAIDGLRRLERAQGRDAAREAVQRLARFLKTSTRDMVLAGRHANGFAVLSPETDRAQGEELRERILREFAALDGGDFAQQNALHLHIGIAIFPNDGASSAFLFDAASRAVAASRRERVSEALSTPQGAAGAPEIDPHPYVFQSPLMKEALAQVARVAQSNASVLLLGDTGTGKEVIAELLHRFSDRVHKPLVAINCSAVPENLLEAELFGYERGAFTGALRTKPGQFELADGGTLFLDEVGDLPLALQSKLLRVLQDRLVVRLGARKGTEVDVRIVTATNRDLRQMMEDGRFRADLYFRLKVITLVLPPLRDRREDIPALVELFVRQFNEESGRAPKTMSTAALDCLYDYEWPGNVRELKNVVSRGLLMAEGDLVLPPALEFDRPRGEVRVAAPAIVVSGSTSSSGSANSPGSREPGAAGSETPRGAASSPDGGRGSSPAPADGLNERQRRLLGMLERGRSIRSREYFTLVGVPARTGLRDLTDLVQRGLIVRDGRRRAAAYRLPDGDSSAIVPPAAT